ncbi:MAG: hypothetical protein AB7S26_11130 [Sandaracinaceae bacterium]
MRLGRAWILGLALAQPLLASGCIVTVTFDPIGQDASISGTWTIDGVPPDAASCAAAGIDSVRVRFFDGEDDYRDHPDLVFPCADGQFDTRPTLLINGGVWTLALIPIRADGSVVETDPPALRETFDTVLAGGHIELTPVDFGVPLTGTRYGASWTIDGATPDATRCDALGIDEVWVQFLDMDGTPIEAMTSKHPCAQGRFTSSIDPGSYSAMVVAVDRVDAILAMAAREDFTLADGETYLLHMGSPVDFTGEVFDPRGTEVGLDAAWTIGGVSASDFACEAAGGTTVRFILYDETDADRSDGVTVAMAPCGAGAFTSASDILRAGTYLVGAVLVDGADTVVARSDFPDPVTLPSGAILDLTTTDLRLLDTTIAFRFEWESPTMTGTFGSCTASSVASMQWDVTLDGATSPLYTSPTTTDPCETFLVFNTASGEPIAPGRYTLYMEGNDTAGKAWSLRDAAACEVVITAAGDLGYSGDLLDCQMIYTP